MLDRWLLVLLRDEHGLRGHVLVLLLVLARLLGVGRRMYLVHRRIGGVVHLLVHLGWRLAVHGAAMLIVPLRRRDRRGRVGLRGVVDGGKAARPLHVCGGHQVWCACSRVSARRQRFEDQRWDARGTCRRVRCRRRGPVGTWVVPVVRNVRLLGGRTGTLLGKGGLVLEWNALRRNVR